MLWPLAMIRVLRDGRTSLTATVHHSSNVPDLVCQISDTFAPTAGRLVFNGFPTGVSVVMGSAPQHDSTSHGRRPGAAPLTRRGEMVRRVLGRHRDARNRS